MDSDKRKELIKTIVLLLVIIAVAAVCTRKLVGGQTLTEFRQEQIEESSSNEP